MDTGTIDNGNGEEAEVWREGKKEVREERERDCTHE